MTYGLGLLLDAGLVLIADTRTNAGVDNVSSYRKLHCLQCGPDREIYAVCSGNLSASQTALGLLLEPAHGEAGRPLDHAETMFAVAQAVGDALREANRQIDAALAPARKSAACMLLGGRIGAQPPRLFLVYEEGNFIECKSDMPFLQIGETKYGRPILDRTIRTSTPLPTAVKIGLLSFDSAMRSNLAVARPLDLVVLPADAGAETFVTRIEKDDPYFDALSARWSELLLEATLTVPDPSFMPLGAPLRPLSVVPAAGR
jgi:putative proteasome-type protease